MTTTERKERELKACPACNFDKAAWKAHCEAAAHYAAPYERYSPTLYKDRLVNRWVVECQNCGLEVLWTAETAEEMTTLWNNLPRTK